MGKRKKKKRFGEAKLRRKKRMAAVEATHAPLVKLPDTPAGMEFPDPFEQDLFQELQMVTVEPAEVRVHAERLWKSYGSPSGYDEMIWCEAESQIRSEKENAVMARVAARHKKPIEDVKTHRRKAVNGEPKEKYTCWELVDAVVGKCDRVLLWGVSGTGKSWAARRNNVNGKQVFSVSLTDDTPAAELRGHYGIVDGSYKWLDGPCIMSWRLGTRCVLNELEKASGDAQTFLLGFLDDIEIAQQTLPNLETLTPKKGFHVVATMNGQPDQDLLPALRDRFPVCIHIDEVAPPALAKLPDDIREIARNSGIVEAAQRRISIRSWNEFSRLRDKVGDAMAAACIFGDRASMVLDHLKLKEAK